MSSIETPEIKKRIPANCKGEWYSSPIFTPANAVDQSQVAKMARNVVLLIKLFMVFSLKKNKAAKLKNKINNSSPFKFGTFGANIRGV